MRSHPVPVAPVGRVLHPRRKERRTPAAVVVLSQLLVEALAVHPDGDVADAGPGVEPRRQRERGPGGVGCGGRARAREGMLSSPWIAGGYGIRRRVTVVPSYRGPEICSQLTFSSGVSRNPLRSHSWMVWPCTVPSIRPSTVPAPLRVPVTLFPVCFRTTTIVEAPPVLPPIHVPSTV